MSNQFSFQKMATLINKSCFWCISRMSSHPIYGLLLLIRLSSRSSREYLQGSITLSIALRQQSQEQWLPSLLHWDYLLYQRPNVKTTKKTIIAAAIISIQFSLMNLTSFTINIHQRPKVKSTRNSIISTASIPIQFSFKKTRFLFTKLLFSCIVTIQSLQRHILNSLI